MTPNVAIQTKSDIIYAWESVNETLVNTIVPLTEFQWTHRPTEKWSIAGHAEHLFLSANPVSSALKFPKGMLQAQFGLYEGEPHDFEALRTLYKKQLAAAPLPVNPVAPSEVALPKEALLQSWAMVKEKIPQRLDDWSEEELDRYCLLHPLLGPLSVRGMLFFTIFHTSHHLETIKGLV